MSDTIRVWTRKEIEEAALIEPEHLSMIKVRISMKLLKLMIDYAASYGEHVEVISAYDNPEEAWLRFFRRD